MARKFTDEPKRALRFSDADEEPRRRLPPIKGYENMPVVSLEEATTPLIEFVPEIEHMVWTARDDCNEPKNGLTSDELASIKLYSMDWEPSDKSFYAILNKILRSENRQQLKPWFLYLRLVLTALAQLVSSRLTVFRGVKMDLRAEYPEGSTFIWWGFTSCTSSVKVLESDRFLGKKGVRTLFTIECHTGKDIRKHSFYHDEDEILLLPGRQFKVVSCLDSGNSLYMIHLKEIEPPFALLASIPQRNPSSKSKQSFDSLAPCNTKHIDVVENNDTDQDESMFTTTVSNNSVRCLLIYRVLHNDYAPPSQHNRQIIIQSILYQIKARQKLHLGV